MCVWYAYQSAVGCTFRLMLKPQEHDTATALLTSQSGFEIQPSRLKFNTVPVWQSPWSPPWVTALIQNRLTLTEVRHDHRHHGSSAQGHFIRTPWAVNYDIVWVVNHSGNVLPWEENLQFSLSAILHRCCNTDHFCPGKGFAYLSIPAPLSTRVVDSGFGGLICL